MDSKKLGFAERFQAAAEQVISDASKVNPDALVRAGARADVALRNLALEFARAVERRTEPGSSVPRLTANFAAVREAEKEALRGTPAQAAAAQPLAPDPSQAAAEKRLQELEPAIR